MESVRRGASLVVGAEGAPHNGPILVHGHRASQSNLALDLQRASGNLSSPLSAGSLSGGLIASNCMRLHIYLPTLGV